MRTFAPDQRAGFALSLLLFALAWPERAHRPEACSQPVFRGPGEVVCVLGPEVAPRLEGPVRRLFGKAFDPNRADSTSLETLPGIGPALASAIVRERCKRPFASIEDMRRVPGIGAKKIRRLEPFLAREEGLARVGPASVNSGSCRTTCEDGGAPARNRPDCAQPRRRESTK